MTLSTGVQHHQRRADPVLGVCVGAADATRLHGSAAQTPVRAHLRTGLVHVHAGADLEAHCAVAAVPVTVQGGVGRHASLLFVPEGQTIAGLPAGGVAGGRHSRDGRQYATHAICGSRIIGVRQEDALIDRARCHKTSVARAVAM